MTKRIIITPRTNTQKSKWTLPGTPQRDSSLLQILIINNFNRNTKFTHLSSEKRAALGNLSKHKGIIVKGGAFDVWRADLYQKEALRQLSDTS